MIFDCVLHVLSDGESHGFVDIMDELKPQDNVYNEKQIELALTFLENYSLIEPVHGTSTVHWKLTKPLLAFLKRIKELEG
jgi:hypothetical protein